MKHVLVIGGGASGLMAAIFAARSGADVTLVEQNEKLGKKIYITGKGRCNLTNDADRDTFLAEVARNPRFLYSALDFFGPRDMMALLEDTGCPVVVQRGRRVFPASEKASDVTRALEKLLLREGVHVLLNTRVTALVSAASRVTGAKLSSGLELQADAVVLATGGLSYPSTGSTGDGYRWAESLGLTVTPPSPVLTGLETVEDWPCQLQGLSLRNVALALRSGGKTLYSDLGELLFTHYGVSGPLVLTASCHLPGTGKPALLQLDLKPGLSMEPLDARLLRELSAGARKQLSHMLPVLLPARMAAIFPGLCGIPSTLPCNQVTAQQRIRLAETLKNLAMTVRSPRPVTEAVVTRGGVSVSEVNPGTMACRNISGLYLAGEMIDVDAHTGGSNLQIAWATGALAGTHAALDPVQTESK